MSYHCGDCEKDLEELLPDGTCPDCYSAEAVRKKASAVTDRKSEQPIDKKQFFAEKLYPFVKSMYPDLVGEVTNVLLSLEEKELLNLLKQPKELRQRVDEVVLLLVTSTETRPLSTPRMAAPPPLVTLPHPRVLLPTPASYPRPLLVPHRDQIERPDVASTRGNRATHAFLGDDVDGRRPSSQSRPLLLRSDEFSPTIQENPLLRTKPSARPPSDVSRGTNWRTPVNGRQPLNDKPLKGVSLFESLTEEIQNIRVPIRNELDACDANMLYAAARHLQSSVEVLETVRIEFENRVKTVLGGEISLKQMVYGLEKTPLPNLNEPEKKRRERRNVLNSDTIVVTGLPVGTKTSDLIAYFALYCDHITDVKNVFISTKDQNTAFVTLAHESILRKILVHPDDHMIRNNIVSVTVVDEDEYVRRRAAYQIFVYRLSSFTSEETFEDYLTENYGKVAALYYHPNFLSPSVDNAYAYISFEERKVTDDILQAQFLHYHGRNIPCKPHMTQRNFIEAKKKEGTFDNNWREPRLGPHLSWVPTRVRPAPGLPGGRLDLPTGPPGGEPTEKPEKPEKTEKTEKIEKTKNVKNDEKPYNLCCVCAAEEITMVLKPCNHMCLCEGCARDMDTCPCCRSDVKHKEKVFLVTFG